MQKIMIFISLGLLWAGVVQAQPFDEDLLYAFILPEWNYYFRDYDANLRSYPVHITFLDETSFLIVPTQPYSSWAESFQQPEEQHWTGSIGTDGTVEISGVMFLTEWSILVELTGKFLTENTVTGQLVFRVSVGVSEDSLFTYQGAWGLSPFAAPPLSISPRMTYDGPPPPPRPTFPPDEVRAQYPSRSDQDIKRFARHDSYDREYFYKRLIKDDKLYFDNLLAELSWNEMPYTPGILLLINHLATVYEPYQQEIATIYVRDGSVHFFGDLSYADLQQFPPLFLILYVLEQMPEGDIAGLQKVSSRFVTMLEAYQAIPPEELADLPAPEFMMKISEQLPEEFRESYFEQSPKLRNYVAVSDDERLKALYPF